MLEALEQLLILQDRDRKISYLQSEIASLDPQRSVIQNRAANAKADAETRRHAVMEQETERKKLELDVESKKQQIERYALQQYQTKKNEEYRALAKEINVAKKAIHDIEDEELDIMERMEVAQKQAAAAAREATEAEADAAQQLNDLKGREANLQEELTKLQAERRDIAATIPETHVKQYERLRRNKGGRVLVGVDHGVCGGCHMRLPAQLLISCRAQQEITSCINCGRLLYYTRDMVMDAAE